jgi:hypothetical protein
MRKVAKYIILGCVFGLAGLYACGGDSSHAPPPAQTSHDGSLPPYDAFSGVLDAVAEVKDGSPGEVSDAKASDAGSDTGTDAGPKDGSVDAPEGG